MKWNNKVVSQMLTKEFNDFTSIINVQSFVDLQIHSRGQKRQLAQLIFLNTVIFSEVIFKNHAKIIRVWQLLLAYG